MSNQPVQISDIVVDSVASATKFVRDTFHVNQGANIKPYIKIISAIRLLPPEAHEQVVKPVIEGIANELKINIFDPDQVEAMSDLFALAVQDCLQMIMENMNRQAMATNALRQGKGGLLKL